MNFNFNLNDGVLRNYLTECIGVTSEMMNILREWYLE